jgi:hypothetical protein
MVHDDVEVLRLFQVVEDESEVTHEGLLGDLGVLDHIDPVTTHELAFDRDGLGGEHRRVTN